MDKKKLIGTLIGVMLFAALIAGATFAWLTFNATIVSGTYDATSENFVINYAGGTDITQILDIQATPTVSNVTKIIKVSAYRDSTNSTGTLYLKLTTSSTGTLTTGSVVRYAVCSASSDTATNCTGNLTEGSAGVLKAGAVNKTGEIELYSTNTIPTTQTYYWIYFWIDAATFTNTHTGQSFSGYVHASATQN